MLYEPICVINSIFKTTAFYSGIFMWSKTKDKKMLQKIRCKLLLIKKRCCAVL